APAAAQPARAEIILENAKLVTLDPRQPQAEALAIGGGRILRVGARRDLEPLRGPETRVIDCQGRCVIPGLNDSHTHFIRGGLSYAQELRWDGVPSVADAMAMLRAQARRTAPPNWVQVVGGWTPVQFAERRFPTMAEIEAATGDTPVFVQHLYERAFINRAGMRLLGIGRDTPEPPATRMERDDASNPTGVFFGRGGIAGLIGLWARLPRLSEDQQIASTKAFMREHNRLGITSVVDAGGGGQAYPEDYAVVARLARQGELTLRIAYSLFAQNPGREIENYRRWVGMVRPGEGDDFFRMLGGGEYLAWSAVDGSMTADPADPPVVMESQLVEVTRLVVSQGWPFRLHVTHDRTVQRVLGVLEQVHREMPIDRLRWAFDHCEGIGPQSLERVARLGGAVAIQNRMSLGGDAYLAKWGPEVAGDAPPLGRIIGTGLPMPAGTDANRAVSHNVWVGLHWLVTGKTVGGTPVLAERNRQDRTAALRAYTEAGAWLTKEEDRKGRLQEGMFADLAVLSDDYMTVEADRIPHITSVLTIVGGKVAHGEGAYAGLAPPPPPVSPDWLPAGHYPGYHRRADGGASPILAAPAPQRLRVVGADGIWELGCSCAA
ncbi:amidohydrolase, partial [Falsiroseomonas oryzae]|uniref:amidohydrolase n=1 Tax=Falsiroseomonas oryzae TaxID=2766473 RepID=UPI0022EB638A